MNAISLISDLESRGAKLSVASDHLQIDAPKGVVGPEDREMLRRRKAEIISLLLETDDDKNAAHQLGSDLQAKSIKSEYPEPRAEVKCIFCERSVEMGSAARVVVGGFNAHVYCYERIRKTRSDGYVSAKYDPSITLKCEACGEQLNRSDAGINWLRDNGRVLHKLCAQTEKNKSTSRCPENLVTNREFETRMALAKEGGEMPSAEPGATPVLCNFCGKPVKLGTPGTGAVGGQDLHIDCYWKKYPNGHLTDEK